MKTTTIALAALCVMAAYSAHAHEQAHAASRLPGAQNAKVTLVYQHAIPDMPGKSIKGVLVEYGPGGYSPSHTLAPSALIYATVIEGQVRSRLNGGPERTYRAGENWTEVPGDHMASAPTRARPSPRRSSPCSSLTTGTLRSPRRIAPDAPGPVEISP